MGYANPIFLRAIPFSKSIQIPFWLGGNVWVWVAN